MHIVGCLWGGYGGGSQNTQKNKAQKIVIRNKTHHDQSLKFIEIGITQLKNKMFIFFKKFTEA